MKPGDMRCLIVEADNAFALRVGRLLGSSDLCWEIVCSWAGAEHLLKEVGYQALLVGFDYAHEEAVCFMQRVRLAFPSLPILTLANHLRPGLKEYALEAGADDCVSGCSSLDSRELKDRIHKVLRRP